MPTWKALARSLHENQMAALRRLYGAARLALGAAVDSPC